MNILAASSLVMLLAGGLAPPARCLANSGADLAPLMRACAERGHSADALVDLARQGHGFAPADIAPGTLRMARVEEAVVDTLPALPAAMQSRYLAEVYAPRMRAAASATHPAPRPDSRNTLLARTDGTVLDVWQLSDAGVVGCLFYAFAPQPAQHLPEDFVLDRARDGAHGRSEIYRHADRRTRVTRTLPAARLSEWAPARPQTTSVILISTARAAQVS